MDKISATVLVCMLCFLPAFLSAQAQNEVLMQPVSEKFTLPQELEGVNLKKVLVDYNNVVYVLTDEGIYRKSDNRLVKDNRYQAIAGRKPVDVVIQEQTGYLYYLFDDEYLSNEGVDMNRHHLDKERFNLISVNKLGDVLTTGAADGAYFSGGKRTKLTVPDGGFISIKAFGGQFFGLTGDGVYLLKGNAFVKIHSGKGLQTFSFDGGKIYLGTPGGYYAIDALSGRNVLSLQTKIPIRDVRELQFYNGSLWAGTPDGAFKKEDKFRYYASKRWVADNDIGSIAFDSRGDVYLLSASGLSRIKFTPMSLLEKAEYFENKIRQRHLRYGLLSLVHMPVPGDIGSAVLVDTDNDGLWSSFYIGSRALKYKVTGDTMARFHAWQMFDAYERLLSVNPIKGFPARTYAKENEKVSGAEKWHPSPDSGWKWKGTTSSDEFVGYIFVASLMHQFVAHSPEEKKRIADFIDAILMHIIDNNYNFVDIDGKPTLWGRWHPDYVNSYAKTISDRKLASTDIIAGLELGYALTGKKIYKSEAERLIVYFN